MKINLFDYLIREFILYSLGDPFSFYGNHRFYDSLEHTYCIILDAHLSDLEGIF